MFTNRQKISLIISIWLYFVWIFVICALMRANFKGNFIGCVIVGGIGCVIVLLMYAIVFIDRYYISFRYQIYKKSAPQCVYQSYLYRYYRLFYAFSQRIACR